MSKKDMSTIPVETDKEKQIELKIDYCSSWGYDKKAIGLSEMVKLAYPKTNSTLTPIPGHTGCFEVMVNGQLLHSKKNGDGHLNNPAQFISKIKNAVEL